MIKAGIIGGYACITGDLIRILLHHPDVEITWVVDKHRAGLNLSEVFPDLIGDIDLAFTDTADFENIDVLFALTPLPTDSDALSQEDLRIITIGEAPAEDFIHGVPELNRKAMVRGGKRVAIPPATEGLLELALLPMAKNLLLNSSIHANILDPSYEENIVTLETSSASSQITARIANTLRELQKSFAATIDVITVRDVCHEGILASIYFDCNVELDELFRLYEDFFSDHNFTYVSRGSVTTSAVLRTNKCIIGLDKAGNRLLITAVIDERLKGCAGTAVHAMNLLFGLYERAGF